MSVSIRVYPNKLDSTIFEECLCDAGLTITEWLLNSVPAYSEREQPLMSMTLNGFDIEPEYWPVTLLQSGNRLEVYIEPRDPVTVTLTVIAVVSAAAAIYYANQSIPDTYNSTVPKGSPVYSVNAQGNQPRLMGVVPEVFGRHKVFPDYLNQVRREFQDNKEYLFLMLSVGVGQYDIDPKQIFIGDTSIHKYASDIEYTVYPPGADVSGSDAHKNVFTSKEVARDGFELLGPISNYEYNGTAPGEAYVKRMWGNKDINAKYYFASGNGSIEGRIAGYTTGAYIEFYDCDPLLKGIYFIEKGDSLNAPCSYDGTLQPTSKLLKVDPETLELITDWAGFPIACGEPYTAKSRVFNKGAEGDFIGPFSAAPAGVLTDRVSLDFKFGSGLAILDGDGNPTPHSVTIKIYWREKVDGSNWNIITRTFSDSTVNELSYTVDVNLGGYKDVEIKVLRHSKETDDLTYREKCEWVGLKSELPAATSYPDVTTIALKIRGTNALASTAENKVNLIATRYLPTWSGSSFGSSAPTTDIAPVVKYLADQCELPVDMDELKRLHDIWKARGDEFNGVFDNPTTAWEALKRILAVGFAEPTLDFGQLVPVRDEQRATIEHMYMPQNILPNSWKMNATLFDASEPDGVEVEYMDGSAGTWKSETIMCTLPGEAGENPEKVRAYGITDRTKAYQFGMRKRSAMRYRRKQHKFATEMDGLNSNYLSYDGLAIQSPSFSQTGELLSYEGNILVLSEPVEFSAGTHYIALRKPDGTASGPYECVKGEQDSEVIISQSLDFNPVINGRQEPPFFMFGVASEWCERVLIQDIQPSGTDRVNLTAISDDPRVYAYDDAVAPN
ncbi:host specificity factor TipJ family phage tail protein [Bermanella sp. R86510]|uniref:host specificity factor TipJ family phage tail protein n=1 Tax=unclassified Bermanella TaxID=2627862 RepID=UPI0037CC48FD